VSPSGTMSAPITTPSGTPGGNFTFNPACEPLTVTEVQTISGWETLKSKAEESWGSEKYNVLTNDQDFPQQVAQNCNGTVTGWVWFQYFKSVKGHYKWALQIEEVITEPGQRTVSSGNGTTSGGNDPVSSAIPKVSSAVPKVSSATGAKSTGATIKSNAIPTVSTGTGAISSAIPAVSSATHAISSAVPAESSAAGGK